MRIDFRVPPLVVLLLATAFSSSACVGPRPKPTEAPTDHAGQRPATFEGGFSRFVPLGVDTLRIDWSKTARFDRRESFAVLPPDLRPGDSPPGPPEWPETLSFSPPSFQENSTLIRFRLEPNDRVFGLGDKTRGADRRGHSYEFWNTDAYGYDSKTDPLYKSIPFFLVVNEERAYGVFFDSPARAHADVGKSDPDFVTLEFEQTDVLSAYLLSGESPRDILQAYTRLTGRTPLPPLWALGFHMSRYGYMSEKEVREVVGRLRSGRHPTDAIWLDIDFQDENAPFTINEVAFPSFDDMISDFLGMGVRTVAITDPHIKSYQDKPSAEGYTPYESGVAGDHFIRDGDRLYEGKVWPGQSVFPEFTQARTRTWWGGLYEDFARRGIAGFWNDMNEPVVFVDEMTMPTDTQHRLDDGTSLSHVLVHNDYGMLNARGTYDGLRRLRPEERPFILTRAASSGVQRYAASWTGDNTANWQHLALSIEQLNNLGVSGFPFVGADVGGFIGCPSPDLLATWMELGAYQPFYRNHSQKGSCAREPWVHGEEIEARTRRALERRYELLPYIYTLFEQSSRDGSPIVRPLWFDYPSDPGSLDETKTFLLGSDIVVSTRLDEKAKAFEVTFPPGRWFDRETGQTHEGPSKKSILASSDVRVREFARAGAIIPEGPVVQHSGELTSGVLTLHVYPGKDCRGAVYADDGHSMRYQDPSHGLRLSYSCLVEDGRVTVKAESQGTFEPWWTEVRLTVHSASDANSRSIPVALESPGASFEVTIP